MPSKYRQRKQKVNTCYACGQLFPFCWTCRCGFQLCQSCMNENLWGLTCNGITWTCPDCGQQNGFGNQ